MNKVITKLQNKPLLELMEVAEILEVSKQTISNWTQDGCFPKPIAGRKYSSIQIEEWLKGNHNKQQFA